ncbi:MAG TPA: PAS domain S-box protein [Deltaproteobacteria bacterium]|nr:PAS domain S-box protein [Deltaproteobacteria bacterium]
MRNILTNLHVAVIGGGRVCKAILEIVLDPSFSGGKPIIIGVADVNDRAEGLSYAREKGVYTTNDYHDLFALTNLDAIIELTGDNNLLTVVSNEKPAHVTLVDHFDAMSLWDYLLIEQKREDAHKRLIRNIQEVYQLGNDVYESIGNEFDEFSKYLLGIISERTSHLQDVERDLVRRDRTISQIIEGNTIPTFVIDQNHVVTHWNKAIEKVTGYRARDIVGTKNHWKAFYPEQKACMADLIVDGTDGDTIKEFFNGRSRPSKLIKGAYQAEDFFPHMGDSGRWLFFTAAPLIGINGETVGSIETLWDTTEQKEAKRKLEELEALEASILDSIHIAVLVLRERRIIFANGAVETVFGWKPDELIGKGTEVIYRTPEDYQKIGAIFYEALTEHRSFRYEFPCRRKDGRDIICMIRTSRVGEHLKERTIVASYEDITERREAEKERVRRERTLSQIIQGSTIPTFVIDKNHCVTHWNKALERLTGYKAKDMIGTNRHWKAFYADEKPIMADLIVDKKPLLDLKRYYGERGRESPLIEEAYEAEVFYPHMGTGGKWLYFTAAPIKDPDGDIIAAIETIWDTTDSKLLQEERENHIRQLSSLCEITTALSDTLDLDARLRSAMDGIISKLDVDSVGIYLREDKGEFRVACSRGYYENSLRKGESAQIDKVVGEVARAAVTMILEDISVNNADCSDILLKEGLRFAAYMPLASKEGVFGVIRISSHMPHEFSDEDKNLLAIISNRIAVAIENARLHQEIKMYGQSLEQKVQEKTVRLQQSYREISLSEEKYRTMFDADPTPIIVADRETFRILDVNATALDSYGYSRKDFLKMSFLDLFYQTDKELIDGLKATKLNQSSFFPKRLHKKKSGPPFFVNVHVRSVLFMGRDSLIATTPDITENVEKEAQLIQASKMATLGTMASGIAHEINQPLNVIQVCSDFFKKMIDRGERINDEDLSMMAEEISKNVERAAQTINHMRDFSRQSEVKSVKLDINKPITDVFKILGQQLRVHRIEVDMDLAQHLPLVNGDHNRLEQVFINVITNAKDALDEKEGKYEDRAWKKVLKIRSFHKNGSVIVTVSDNGVGIPEDIKDKIFEPFFTTKDVGKGTGLGMSISYGIIHDYGGTIDVESKVDEGTTFTLTFPSVE